MNCVTCAYFDEDNKWCTHPDHNVEPNETVIRLGCMHHKVIEE